MYARPRSLAAESIVQCNRGATVDVGQRMAFKPECARCRRRVNTLAVPPCRLVARVVHLAMMSPTQRYGKLVADLLSHGTALRKAKMVRIRRLPPAHQARPLSD